MSTSQCSLEVEYRGYASVQYMYSAVRTRKSCT